MTVYAPSFFDDINERCASSARTLVPYLLGLTGATSVVDVGCGEGIWLQAFADSGVGRVLGIDGDYIERDRLRIPVGSFVTADLSRPFARNESYDLALSLEVAEHLDESSGDAFVESLLGLAPIVVFAAAVPGQGGTNHVNEQWPGYWARKFLDHGFLCFDCLRPRFWNHSEIAWWYRQNLLMFVQGELAREHATFRALEAVPEPLALVHPEAWRAQIGMSGSLLRQLECPGIRDSVRLLLRSIRRWL